jgi:hypothetical protein
MTFTTREVVGKLIELIEGDGGLAQSLEQLKGEYSQEPERPEPAKVKLLRSPADLAEKAWGARYPALWVYCEKIRNRANEKLRRFSGEASVCLEVLVSQDRLEGIGDRLHYYCDALRDVIERKSGCIGEGLYLSSEYEVQYEPVKKGGSQYRQTARLSCTVIVNRT